MITSQQLIEHQAAQLKKQLAARATSQPSACAHAAAIDVGGFAEWCGDCGALRVVDGMWCVP
jgi:hypothetical protein